MDKYNLIERDNESLFFSPGDVVELKQALSNKPIMVIKSIDKSDGPDGKLKLLGITCMWFNTLLELQTARFNTKDLRKYESVL